MLRISRWTSVSIAVATAVAGGQSLEGQVRASERGSVSQTIDGTTIAIDYGRPRVRGREDLFGGEVPWGKVWTPGANWATTLTTDNRITINGHAVSAGEYSVWFEVQPETWTVVFDPEPHRFHLMPPPVTDNQLRFPVTPMSGPNVERLTWSFPSFSATGATLRFAWSDRAINFDVGVQPSLPVTVAAGLAERIEGNYIMQTSGGLGSREVRFDIMYRDGKLAATWESAPNPNLANVWLISLGAGMFAPAELKDGELFDIVMDLVFEFTPLDGRATTFELRALGDALWGTGRRVSGQ